MPQMKELKELKLLVKQRDEKGRYGEVMIRGKSKCPLYLPTL